MSKPTSPFEKKTPARSQAPAMAATASSGERSSINLSPALPRTVGTELNVIQTIFGRCFCADAISMLSSSKRPPITLMALDGIECISLGAVTDEQTSKERVSRTVMQLASNPERLISVGYLKDGRKPIPKNTPPGEDTTPQAHPQFMKITEVVPIEAWRGDGAGSSFVLPLSIGTAVENLKQNEFDQTISVFQEMLREQRENKIGDNIYLEGITVHNIGVVHLLAGNFDKAFPVFKEAVRIKQKVFGDDHPEVAISLVETGILLYAMEKYEDALQVFNDALKIRIQAYGSDNPKIAMVLNNKACSHFEIGNPLAALGTFQEARDIQQLALGSSQKADLDLLHVATTLCNIGYIKLQVKNYEEARTVLEDALLVQQSVLGDDHKAVKDTLSNIEFANAFHS